MKTPPVRFSCCARRLFSGGGSGFFSLLLGFGIIALMEYRDTTLRSERDIWAFTKLPTLGVISFTGDFDEIQPKRRWFTRKPKTGIPPTAKPLMTGSHTDTVHGGGRFDGIVGVMGAIEVVRLLRGSGIRLQHDLLIADFYGEETNDFGLTCLGSRSMVGELEVPDLDRANSSGLSLGRQLELAGLDPNAAVRRTPHLRDGLHAFVELHIEQGPLLEERAAAIGVVTAISGIQRLFARFTGRPDHAGAMPMLDRHDALVAAAEAVLAIRREGCAAPVHGVATATRIESSSTSLNVVPSSVQLQAELRSVDLSWLTSAQRRLTDEVLSYAHGQGVDVSFEWSMDNEVTASTPAIADVVGVSADRFGMPWIPVPSGATHDAAHLATLGPMGMIFVPLFGIVMGEVDDHEVGSASGLLTSVEQLGASLGVAVLGTVFFGVLRLEDGGPVAAIAAGRHLTATEHTLGWVLGLIAVAWAVGWLLPRRGKVGMH